MTKLFLFIVMVFSVGAVFGQTANEPDKATILIKDQTVPSFKFEISKGK